MEIPRLPAILPQDIAAEISERFGYSFAEADRMIDRYFDGDGDPTVQVVMQTLGASPA